MPKADRPPRAHVALLARLAQLDHAALRGMVLAAVPAGTQKCPQVQELKGIA